MGCWSAMHAKEAYLHTVQLCKEHYNYTEERKVNVTSSSHDLMEPKSMEYISALASGSQAQLLVDVGLGGASPATVALAIAAKQTKGRLICIRDRQESLDEARRQIQQLGDLAAVAKFELGKACEVIKQLKKLDFAVIDSNVEGCMEVLKAMDMNPKCSIVVVLISDHLLGEGRSADRVSYGQVVRGRGGCEYSSTVLPIGQGLMEVTRIGRIDGGARGRHLVSRSTPKGTFLVYDESNSKVF